ncbi:hypothetical protein PSV09DRAFT_2434689 [Bipolaris maydis]|nr:hypothetical protein J3E73DRAFT_382215 [Bipolaris maydis]KAJ6208445.1 hypothetical protein PSV09DRAFT_2434689 [Bipolaris maydis]KAJ6270423.1 hypothetical protein PSV08DRAFT_224832 [Bipolaris maydis]KAJ6284050.1 hypothetical protein J3E71DRAFT_397933 [Bipolaris maydis]
MAVVLFLSALVTPFGMLGFLGYRLLPLLSKRSILAFSPNSLRIREVVVAILAMMLKSVFYSVTKMPGPTPVGLHLRSPLVISAQDVVRFHSAVGHREAKLSHLKHGQLVLFLSAMTEPGMLLLLASPWCPVNPLGAVNVRNTFELICPDLCDLEKLTNMDSMYLDAVMHAEPTRVKRGVEWALEITISAPSDRNNGTYHAIFRQVFTMLEFKKTSGSLVSKGSDRNKHDASAPGSTLTSTQISLSKDDPLKWAALCKDYNFIHLSGLAAKLFGLPGKLAHGNHAAAKALQSLPDAGNTALPNSIPLQMQVDFKKPMVVPAIFEVCIKESPSTGIVFEILQKGKVHATGAYGPLESDR